MGKPCKKRAVGPVSRKAVGPVREKTVGLARKKAVQRTNAVKKKGEAGNVMEQGRR